MPKDNPTRGEKADRVMRALNLSDIGIQSAIEWEKFRRMAGGNAAMLKNANKVSEAYGSKAGLIGHAIEAGNTAWLASDPEKRARVEAEYEETAKKPALERMFEGFLSPSDMFYATGKSVYDTGKTYESIQRSEMDAENNSLLRKIAQHEAQLELERKKQVEKSKALLRAMPEIRFDQFDYLGRQTKPDQSSLANSVMSAIRMK